MNNSIPLIGDFSEQEYLRWQSELQRLMPNEQIVPFSALSEAQKAAAEVAIVANPDPSELAQLPNLVWVQSLWAGVEKILPLFERSAAKLVRLVDPALADAMSEAILTWSLFLHRDMHHYQRQQSTGLWRPRAYLPAQERRIGILGLGELGQTSALRLRDNGFQVSGWSRKLKDLDGITCLSGETGLQQILADSDILICLLPLTDETRHLLNLERLKLLKNDASLINFARGAIIDDDALLRQLSKKPDQYAVLDVFAVEPLPQEHIFWQHNQITVLPHISAPTRLDTACAIVAENIRRYRESASLPDTVQVRRGY